MGFEVEGLIPCYVGSLFPGVGLLDFKLNSSPRPELFSSPGLLLAHPWSAQPQSVPGVPNSRVSPDCPQNAQPQSVAVPSVSLPREGGDVRSQINSFCTLRVRGFGSKTELARKGELLFPSPSSN